MKIIFFGSSDFAVPSLKALISSGQQIPCVVTQPDKRQDRGLSVGSTAIKEAAQSAGLKIYQPLEVNSPQSKEFLNSLKADLFVVIAYGQLFSQEVVDIPKIFSVNLHASLLPLYRGAAPINWTLIKGEAATGITLIKMVKAMDAGPVIRQKETAICETDTALSLGKKLAAMAAELLLATLGDIQSGNYKLTAQDESRASFAPKLKKEDGQINWEKPAQDIYNLVRGCLGWPGAFTSYKGKALKILKAGVFPSEKSPDHPGEVLEVSQKGILVAGARDNLLIEELQPEGKRPMPVSDFIAGHKISRGEFFR